MTDVAIITQTQVTVVSQNVVQVATVGIQGPQGPAGSVAATIPWGNVTGNIANQTDLQAAFTKLAMNSYYLAAAL